MASHSDPRSVTATLSSTTADTVTLTQLWPAVDVTNHATDENLTLRYDGTTAVAEAEGTSVVLPGQSKVMQISGNANNQIVISVVGDGNTYTIEGVN